MTPNLRQCPHCGAYVMTGDNLCPRCDHDLAIPPDSSAHSAPDSGGAAALADPILSGPGIPAETGEWPTASTEPGQRNDDSTELLPRVVPIPPQPDEPTISADTTPPAPEGSNASAPAITLPGFQITPPPEMPPVDESTQPRLKDAPDFPASHTDNPPVEVGAPDEGSKRKADSESGEANEVSNKSSHGSSHASSEATVPRLIVSVAPNAAPNAAEATAPRLTPPPEIVAPPSSITPPYTPRYDAPYAPAYSAPSYQGPAYQTPAYDAVLAQGSAYLQQRVHAYLDGGYRLVTQGPGEATVARGKNLGILGWLFALPTLIGVFWYMLILAGSGFRRDEAYLTLETDGSIYEDGPGAAHIRQERSRSGRRWGMIGLGIAAICVVAVLVLGAVASVVLTQERYRAALREAYPEFTLFEDDFSDTTADADDVRLLKDGAVAYSIVAGIVLVGLWGGLTLVVIGVVHARAYHVRVPALPGYA